MAILVALAAICVPSLAGAAPDLASFESFYRQSWSMSPGDWVLAAVAVIAAAAAVLVFAPSAGPVVTGIGTWIGGLFGFSGIAATNFGLALLGGGSIAAGGFGIVGGTALLTAALTFGTDIVIDYAAGQAVESYQYEKFAAASQQMITLPLPRNKKGPRSYTHAIHMLRNINSDEPLSSPGNRTLIRTVIEDMRRRAIGGLDAADRTRHESMLALLSFVTDDYRGAQEYARAGYFSARAAGMVNTLPAFVLGTTQLYDGTFKFENAVTLFRSAIENESDNPLAPLLFAIFLDRMTYRINDGALSVRDLDNVAAVGESAALGKLWGPVQVVLLSRYVTRLKLEQQKIASLATSSNETIRSNPETLAVVQASLLDYEHLLDRCHYHAGALASPDAISRADLPADLRQTGTLLQQYASDRERLRRLVFELQSYQNSLRQSRKVQEPERVTETAEIAVRSGVSLVWVFILMVAAFIAGLILSNLLRMRGAER
jgi:uncharacterized membrane protein